MSNWPKEYWDYEMVIGNGYDKVRTGWSKLDFQTRTDDTISNYINFKKDHKVAEIGCAMGYTCKMVAPRVEEYVGIDFSKNMLDEASKLNNEFKNAKFVLNDGLTIPFDDNYFDVIYCELVFQHTTEEATLSYIEEINRTIKPNGALALQFPTCVVKPDYLPSVELLSNSFTKETIKTCKYYTYVFTSGSIDTGIQQLCDS